MICSMPLASLVEDFSLYPRHAVDEANVAALVNALMASTPLPPVVACEESLRIIDGWHRVRAYAKVLGKEASIDVELVKYRSDQERLLDAIHRNAGHGRKLDRIDQIRCAQMAATMGIPTAKVSAVLHLTEERLKKISVRIARAEAASEETIPGTLSVALKRPLIHLAGETLTPEQVEAHSRAPGISYLLLARQLKEALEMGFINTKDERLVRALGDLADALTSRLPSLAFSEG